MSCPKVQEALAGLAAADAGLAAHLAGCAECSEAVTLLAGAKAMLAAGRPALSAEARARMWRGIGAAPAPSKIAWWRIGAGAGAGARGGGAGGRWIGWAVPALVVAGAAVFVMRVVRPEVDGDAGGGAIAARGRAGAAAAGPGAGAIAEAWPVGALRAESARALVRPGVRLELAAGAEVVLDREEVRLEAGRLEVELAAGAAFLVVTSEVRLSAVGGRFRVAIEGAGTALEVEDGRVRAGEEVVGEGAGGGGFLAPRPRSRA